MAIWDEIEGRVCNLSSRLGIFKDYATILLLNNNWDDEFILGEWSRDDPRMKSGISIKCEFLSDKMGCANCSSTAICKTYGCEHFVCSSCVKSEVEREISQGNLTPKCLDPDCEMWMCSSVFLADISQSSRNLFKLGMFFSHQSSLPFNPQSSNPLDSHAQSQHQHVNPPRQPSNTHSQHRRPRNSRPRNSQHQTSNSHSQPLNIQHQTSNSHSQPLNSQHQPLNSQHQTSNSHSQPLSSQHQPLNSQHQTSNSHSQPLNSQHHSVNPQTQPVNPLTQHANLQPSRFDNKWKILAVMVVALLLGRYMTHGAFRIEFTLQM